MWTSASDITRTRRPGDIEDVPDVAAGPRQRRVGVADGRDGDANLHRGQLSQRHLDAVLGENGDRPRAIEAETQEAIAQPVNTRQCLCVGRAAPGPGSVTLDDERLVRRALGILPQPDADVGGVGGEHDRILDEDVGAPLAHDGAWWDEIERRRLSHRVVAFVRGCAGAPPAWSRNVASSQRSQGSGVVSA